MPIPVYLPCTTPKGYMTEVQYIVSELSSFNGSMVTELLSCPTNPMERNKLRLFMKNARRTFQMAQSVRDDKMRTDGALNFAQRNTLTSSMSIIDNFESFMPANEERFASLMKPYGGEVNEKL